METVWLRKEKGGTSIGPHDWPEDGSACEVPQSLAADLLRIPDGGFSVTEPPSEDGGEGDGGDGKPARRPRKTAADPD